MTFSGMNFGDFSGSMSKSPWDIGPKKDGVGGVERAVLESIAGGAFGHGGGGSSGTGGDSNSSKFQDEAERQGKWQQAFQKASTAKVADNMTIYEPGRDFNPGAAFLQQGLQQGASGGSQSQGGGWKGAAAGAAGGALSGAAIGAAGGPIGMVGGAVLGGLSGLFCDVRLKTDIAPLERSDVHDELAEMAFLVKEIRECA
jgi:hypothetical protein